MAVAILLAVLVGGGYYYFKIRPADSNDKERTEKVIRADLVVSVSASGVVEPNFQVEVKSKASGEILKFDYEPGDAVKKGDILLTLDQRTEQRNLAQKKADLDKALSELKSARASLKDRKLKLKRVRKLFDKKLVSDQERDTAVTELDMAQARIAEIEAVIAKARLGVEDANERLSETVIRSPIDGVVVEKTVERGQIISSGISSVTGGTKLCVIADLSRLFIFAMVDETDIGKVKLSQKVKVTVDAYDNTNFEGAVTRIYPVGEESDNITAFRVKIEVLDKLRDMLRPKMTANVDMVIESKADTLVIPDEIIHLNDKGESFVYLKSGASVTERVITSGLSNGFETEITEGLTEGDILLRNRPGPDDTRRRSP